MDFIEQMAALLMKNIHCDKPLFYWKKIKKFLKDIDHISAEDLDRFSRCISAFTSALQYNLEEGVKLGKEYDLSLVVKAARLCINSAKSDRIALSVFNIMKYYPDKTYLSVI